MYVEKTKNGKYKFVESYRDIDGKLKRVSVTLEKNNAFYHAKAYQLLIEKINSKLQVIQEEFRLYECIEKYKADKLKKLKQSSYSVISCVCDFFYKNIKDIKMNDISARLIYDIFDNDESRYYFTGFKTFLNWCYRRDFIKSVEFLKKIQIDKPKKTEKKILYLEHKQIEDVLQFFKDNDLEIYHIINILLNTGMRIGELLALEYKDVKKNKIYITKTKYGKNITTPKTKSSVREISVNQDVINSLNALKSNVLSLNKQYFIKKTYAGLVPKLKKYKKIKLHFHLFRHTHASLLIEKGISVEAVSRRLGHEDTKITQEIYIHLTKKLKDKEDEMFKNLNIVGI